MKISDIYSVPDYARKYRYIVYGIENSKVKYRYYGAYNSLKLAKANAKEIKGGIIDSLENTKVYGIDVFLKTHPELKDYTFTEIVATMDEKEMCNYCIYNRLNCNKNCEYGVFNYLRNDINK